MLKVIKRVLRLSGDLSKRIHVYDFEAVRQTVMTADA